MDIVDEGIRALRRIEREDAVYPDAVREEIQRLTSTSFPSSSMSRISGAALSKRTWYDTRYIPLTYEKRPGRGTHRGPDAWVHHRFTSVVGSERKGDDDRLDVVLNIYGETRADVVEAFETHAYMMLRWLHAMVMETKENGNDGCGSTNAMRVATLHWLLIDIPKRMVDDDENEKENENTLREHMVNTGYTWPCQTDGVIVIYRKEDAFKVFVHETVHLFGYDVFLLKGCPRTLRVSPAVVVDMREVVCELFARLYYVADAAVGVPTGLRGREDEKDEKNDEGHRAHLEKNVVWSVTRAENLLRYGSAGRHGLVSILGDDTHEPSDIVYAETTPAFSYYVATGILLFCIWHGGGDALVVAKRAPRSPSPSVGRLLYDALRSFFRGEMSAPMRRALLSLSRTVTADALSLRGSVVLP